jgi:hypothetical protein
VTFVGWPPILYTDSAIAAGAPIRAAHIAELRAGVIALE